jgi:hypothetical protein
MHDARDTPEGVFVRAVCDDRNEIQVVQTDARGAFTFFRLEAGRYSVTASRPPYIQVDSVTGVAGSKIVIVRSAEARSDLVLDLEPGVSVSGVVRNTDGSGLPLISVVLYKVHNADTEEPGLGRQVAQVLTDARGEFRFAAVAPGAYAIAAPTRPTAFDPRTRFGRQFFPDQVHFNKASVLSLAPESARSDITFLLRPEQTSTLSGQLLDAHGRPSTAVTLQLISDDVGLPATSVTRVPTRTDGGFSVAGVVPGAYRAFAHDSSDAQSLLLVPLVVEENASQSLVLQLRRTASVDGVVLLAGSVGTSRPMANAVVTLRRTPLPAVPLPIDRAVVTTGSDGRFSVAGLTGKYLIAVNASAETQPEQTIVERIDLDGVRLASAVIDTSEIATSVLKITMSNQSAELSGVVLDPNGRPTSSYAVVLFPASRAARPKELGRSRFVQPDANGWFSLAGLAEGQYLLAAVSTFDSDEVLDTAVLQRIESAAIAVALKPGEKRRLDMRVQR